MKMTALGYTTVHFSLLDRVRLLFGKRLKVTINTSLDTSKLPDDFQMATSPYIAPFWERKHNGAAQAARPQGEITK